VRPTLFLSDLHLSPARPALVAAFHAFCTGPARGAAGVYLLGDLFDDWIGDDQLREPLPAAVAGELRALTAAGVAVGVVTGNRDFLIGDAFAHATGATLLSAPLVINLAGTPTVLLHGDELCTADRGYQRMRRITHNPLWQRRYLALPYKFRRGFANWVRNRSRSAISGKPPAIMDVEPQAVESAFREAGVTRMIHGHTHLPARHHLLVDGRDCERFVLADWYERGSYLEFDAAGGRTRDIAAPGS
jgi:UDP-2,3-diacylglucosamine hydrolase